MKSLFKKADIALIIFFSLTAAVFNFLLYGYQNYAATISSNPKMTVRVAGEIKAMVELSQDGIYEVTSDGWLNIIEITDGKAKMLSADCRDQLCIRQKPVQYSNEVIVCLPHKLIVEIENKKDENQLDMISY